MAETQNTSKGEARGVLSDFLYNLLYQVVRMVLPLVTIPYISRVLGAENLGVYNYTQSIAVWFAMAAYLGFENHGNRLIAQRRKEPEELNRAFTGAYCFQLLAGIVAVAAYVAYMQLFCRENQSVAWLQLLYIGSELFNISWLQFGLGRHKRTALVNISVRLISFLAILLFVRDRGDTAAYTLICTGSLLISALLLWLGVFRQVRFVWVRVADVWKYGKGALVLFFPVLVICVYRSMDKVMLGNLISMTEVALYANADKIVEIPFGVITALGVVMIPRMTSLVAEGQTEKSRKYIEISLRFMILLACGMSFGMMGVGKVLAPVFFGEEFIPSGRLIMIIAPMVIVRACANVVRTQYLLPNRRDKDYIISIVIGVVINLVLNSLLIPVGSSAGAAVATLFAESFVAMYQVYACRKAIPVARYIFRNWFFAVAGLIMFVLVYRYGETHTASVRTLIIQIVIGVTVYGVLAGGYLLKKEKRLLHMLLKR